MSYKDEITYGIESNIRNAIRIAIENGRKEQFLILDEFIRKIIFLSLENSSIQSFKDYLFIISRYYNYAFDNSKNPSVFQRKCISDGANFIEGLLSNYVGAYFDNKNSVKDREISNQYFYQGFNTYSSLLYKTVENKDLNTFKSLVNIFNNITDSKDTFYLKFEIERLENEIEKDYSKIEESKLIEKIYSQFKVYKRHVITGIKYWIYYLYKEKNYDEEITIQFLDLLKIPDCDADESLDDILFIRSGKNRAYFEWDFWDNIDRSNYKLAWSPPVPEGWMTLGFIIEQIRENTINPNLEKYDSNELMRLGYLYDNFIVQKKIIINNFEFWKNILKIENVEILELKIKNILSILEKAKGLSSKINNDEIAKQPLSISKIEDFKDIIFKSWSKNNQIRKLFQYFNNTLEIDKNGEELMSSSNKIFFERAKIMFIDGPQYSPIYGVERYGGEIGRNENDLFFYNISKKFNKITGNDVVEILEKSILELKKNKRTATVIIISNEARIYESNLYQSKKFIKESKIKDIFDKNLQFVGLFDEIPIFSIYSNFLTKKILVSDFKSSFIMKYKSDSEWMDGILKVKVTEVSDGEARKKLIEDRGKWTILDGLHQYHDEGAITAIKTSVNVDMETILNFEIVDNNSFIIGMFKSEIDN